jgi:hypothetical protein
VLPAFLDPALQLGVNGGKLLGADGILDDQAAIAPKAVNLILF